MICISISFCLFMPRSDIFRTHAQSHTLLYIAIRSALQSKNGIGSFLATVFPIFYYFPHSPHHHHNHHSIRCIIGSYSDHLPCHSQSTVNQWDHGYHCCLYHQHAISQAQPLILVSKNRGYGNLSATPPGVVAVVVAILCCCCC